MLIDNVLWGGQVVDDADQSDDTVAIRAINDHVAADDRVEVVMLPSRTASRSPASGSRGGGAARGWGVRLTRGAP